MRNRSIFAVYFSGLLAGISLTLFPAAGPLFTDSDFHHLSNSEFGVLFIPQIVMAIASSLLTPVLAKQWGMRYVRQIGLGFMAISMAFLMMSQFLIENAAVFYVLLGATAALGIGFGFTISSLNTYAVDLFPKRSDSAVTALHVMGGTGQVGSALLLSIFLELNAWWGAPLVIGAVIIGMFLFQLRLPLNLSSEAAIGEPTMPSEVKIPSRVLVFALIVFFYGLIEGTFGNWTPIYLEKGAGLSTTEAALGLSLFWGAVVVGRFLFAIAASRFKVRFLYLITPFVLGGVFIILPTVEGVMANYLVILMAGLAASFFFPYSISRASTEFPAQTALVSGALVASVQLGNGVSSNIIGFANEASIPLTTIFQASVIYAVILVGLVIYLEASKRTPSVRIEPQQTIA